MTIFQKLWPFHGANFGPFRNVVIFCILSVFWSRFLQKKKRLLCGSRVVLCMFLTILVFDLNLQFPKPYSLCMVANFGHFGNVVIFRVLGVFWSPFLHKTTLMRFYSCFWYAFHNSFFSQSDDFSKAVASPWWPTLAFLKMLWFFK